MAREKKTKASEQQENTVSVDMAKLTEGINLVFSGAVKMLEAMGTAIDVSTVPNTVNNPAVSDTGGESNVEKTDKATEETDTTSIQPQEKTEEKSQEEKPQKPGNTARPITTDDITRIIVRKIKQNKDNNEKIGQVLKTYGVERVSDLKPEQYIINLVYALKRPYRKKAAFIMNDKILAIVRTLKDSEGQYLWQQSFKDGEPERLAGYPVYTSEYAPTNMISFGDYSYYNIGDRGTRSFKKLTELFAGNDMVGFVAKERVDGKLVLPEAVQILKIGTTGKVTKP